MTRLNTITFAKPTNTAYIKIIYENNKTIVVNSSTIHPAILQEIYICGCADFMFEDGTFATLIAI